jgi:3-polyprenyl-4-hydroxybenzoate decarboxylase
MADGKWQIAVVKVKEQFAQAAKTLMNRNTGAHDVLDRAWNGI